LERITRKNKGDKGRKIGIIMIQLKKDKEKIIIDTITLNIRLYQDSFINAVTNKIINNFDELLKTDLNKVKFISVQYEDSNDLAYYYFKNCLFHNYKAAAYIEYSNGKYFKEYYLNGIMYDKEDWLELPERIRELRNEKLKLV
jgi:hypothetical protein